MTIFQDEWCVVLKLWEKNEIKTKTKRQMVIFQKYGTKIHISKLQRLK